VRNDAIKAAQAEPFARQIGGCVQILPRVWVGRNSIRRSTLSHVCLCWSLQVTKVMILSILFSLKEEQDHEREKEAAARVTFVTSVLKLNLEPPTPRTPREAGFSAPLLHSLLKSRHQGNFMPADALYCLVSTMFNGLGKVGGYGCGPDRRRSRSARNTLL
jgi:hypothetical protein